MKLNDQTVAERQPAMEVAEELMSAWNAHDVDRVMALYAPQYEGIDVGQRTPEHGLDEKRQTVIRYLRAFPDLHFTVEQTIVQDNAAAVSWVARGTHQGNFMHIPPTERSFTVRGASILTLAQGKVISAVYIWDVAGLLREIGLLPDL